MSKKIVNKGFVSALLCMTVIIGIIGEVSVDLGLISFAQGQTEGNIVGQLEVNGLSLKSFSKIPEVMDSIIFVEDTDTTVDELEATDSTEDTGDMGIQVASMRMIENNDEMIIEPLSITNNSEEIVEEVSEEEVSDIDILTTYTEEVKKVAEETVGIGSEVTSILKSNVSKEDYNTLIKVRNAANIVDFDYKGKALKITGANRDNLERLVMGEAGNEGFVGACLVAQTIRDTMVMTNEYDLLTIKKKFAYSGVLFREPNQNVKDAVAFIFDEGGYVVQHRLVYFYAPKIVSSKFHESQPFIVEHGGHRFFDREY